MRWPGCPGGWCAWSSAPLRANLTASFPDLTEAAAAAPDARLLPGFRAGSGGSGPFGEPVARRSCGSGWCWRASSRCVPRWPPARRCCWWPRTSATGSGCCWRCPWSWATRSRPPTSRWWTAGRNARCSRRAAASARGWCPAQELLAHILRGGRTPRAIAMVADQEPRTSERRHWTRFMNRDTAFFMGAEEITRVTKFPAFFVGLRRTAPRPLRRVGRHRWRRRARSCPPARSTERYARLVEAQIQASPGRLAVVAQALEAQEVPVRGIGPYSFALPQYWPWY